MRHHVERIDRICVFRALHLGDMVCAGPALRGLRRRFPGAHVALVGLPWAADFARRATGCVDEFLEFPGWPGLPEREVDFPRLSDFLIEVRERRFDLALQLHGSGRVTNPLVQAFGARHTVAWRPVGEAAPAGMETWPYPETVHEVRRNLQLIAHLGAPVDDEQVCFPLRPHDEAELRTRRPDLARLLAGRFVCLHPGARDPAKRWPTHFFAQVGDALAALGWMPVVTGCESERGLADAVIGAMRAPALHAACDLSIGALAALLARARLLVSNDTGVVHVAAGLRVPSVVVFFATEPSRWAPLDRARHIAIHDPRGVAPRTVIDAARHLLQRTCYPLPA